jgi:dipeptidyl aminopeptidase/acylaminoacyl peptidase
VVNADGSGRKQLVDDLPLGDPAWDRAGRRLAAENFEGHVYVVSATGGPARDVRPRSLEVFDPSWSADGSTLVVVAGSSEDDPVERLTPWVYRVALDGSSVERLAPDARSVVELRAARTGRRLSSLVIGGSTHAMALSRSYLALLIRTSAQGPTTLQVYRPRTAELIASIPVPKGVDSVAVNDSGIVSFSVGRQIRAFDSNTHAARTIATAAATPIGLSVEGSRLAWAENRGTQGVIRAVALPAHLR